MIADAQLIDAIRRTPGPMPWFADGLEPVAVRGRRCEWRTDSGDAVRDAAVCLVDPNQPEQPLLEVAMYTRLFRLPSGSLGLWFETRNGLQVVAIDPDTLEALDPICDKAERQYHGGCRCSSAPLGEFFISPDSESDVRSVILPSAFDGMQELHLVGKWARAGDQACAAIVEVRSRCTDESRHLQVFPQRWFTQDGYDIGYQWITRVARHPDGVRFIGDGIRLPGLFVTTQTGCHMERWVPIPDR